MTVLQNDLLSPDTLFDWPLFGLQDDVRPALADAAERGVPAVLATLYSVQGGAPRGVGAQMVFVETSIAGFLSGGCIEADLALHAKQVLADNRSLRLTYGEGGPMDMRLPCGSRIDVLLEPLEPHDPAVSLLIRYERQRRPALWLMTGNEHFCLAMDEAAHAPEHLRAMSARAVLGREVCGHMDAPFSAFRVYAPQRRLVAIGADPIALAVVKLAVEMGFETVLVRPNGPETCPLPGVQYTRLDAQTAIAACQPDRWTAIAILTHDVEQEHAALTASLGSQAAYVGALGSRRRVPARNARLISSGVASAAVERVHAPIGLPIGGKSPWEIAVSVIAEIVNDMDAAARP